MLIISEEEFLKEISQSPSKSITISESSKKRELEEVNEIPSEIVMENHTYDNFRKPSLPNIPHEMRAVIGALGVTEGREIVAKTFGVSEDTVGDLVNDKHSNGTVSEIKNNILERVKANSLAKLETCIEFLTISKDMKPAEHISIAEGLARIHDKLTPKTEVKDSETKFIFYTPDRQNKVEDYEVVDAAI